MGCWVAHVQAISCSAHICRHVHVRGTLLVQTPSQSAQSSGHAMGTRVAIEGKTIAVVGASRGLGLEVRQ